jgi:hypothetical protein
MTGHPLGQRRPDQTGETVDKRRLDPQRRDPQIGSDADSLGDLGIVPV